MYYGDKICLRAYKEDDIPLATKICIILFTTIIL